MTHDEIDTLIMNKFSGKDIPANIYNVFEFGVEIGRNEVITELLETSNYDELSQKIAWDILERGIERGKALALKEVKDKTIEEVLQTIRKGMSELLKSPWATENYMCNHDYAVSKTMEIIDDLILKKDIEQMKEGGEA